MVATIPARIYVRLNNVNASLASVIILIYTYPVCVAQNKLFHFNTSQSIFKFSAIESLLLTFKPKDELVLSVSYSIRD